MSTPTPMASGEPAASSGVVSFSKSRIPLVGGLVDYVDSSVVYLQRKTFSQAERLNVQPSRQTPSAVFMTFVCSCLGFVCNVKFEVVTVLDKPLAHDLHFMVMSKEDKLYIDDIDDTQVMWCIEASDCVVLFLSCLLISNSFRVRSPLSEYLYLPWLGACLRGLLLRQAPTAGALLYTMSVVSGNVNPLFLTAFTCIFLLEARLWLEVSRMVRARWERHETYLGATRDQVQTLFTTNESVEVRNLVY